MEATCVVGLRCEHLVDPIGLGVAKPRLSWRTATEIEGWMQSGYQIEVRDPLDGAVLWDSGRVTSSESVLIPYEGSALTPHLPTHCQRQAFHFDPASGLLRQHDYTPDVFGSWARAAHVVLEHKDWLGVPVAARRRVTPRRPGGKPFPLPVLVWIEVHDWRLST